jgi:uncharacterized protein involved in exopolysaccharide biosynthesis
VYTAHIRFLVTAPPAAEVSLYGAFRQLSPEEEIARARASFEEVLLTDTVAWLTVQDLDVSIDGAELLKRITVEDVSESAFVHVTVSADTPEEAQLLATSLMQTAVEYYGALQATSATNTLTFIDEQLNAVQTELEDAERRLLQLQIESQVGELESEISSLQTLVGSLRFEHDRAVAEGRDEEAATYDRLIAERTAEVQDLLQLGVEYTALQRTESRAQSLYSLLQDKQTEAKLKENEALDASFIHIVETARLPEKADSPFSVRILVVGLVAAIGLGVFVVFVLESIGRSRGTTSTQVDTHTGESA